MQHQKQKNNRGCSQNSNKNASVDKLVQPNQPNKQQNNQNGANLNSLDYKLSPSNKSKSASKKKKSANGKEISLYNQPSVPKNVLKSDNSDNLEKDERDSFYKSKSDDYKQNLQQDENAGDSINTVPFCSLEYKSPALEALLKQQQKEQKKLGKDSKVRPTEQNEESFNLIIREIDVLKCIFEDQMKVLIPHGKKMMGQIQIDLFQHRIPENLRTIIRFKYTYTFEYPHSPVHFVVEPKQNIPDRIDPVKFKNQLIDEIKAVAKQKQERMEESVYDICQMILEHIKEFDEEWLQQQQAKMTLLAPKPQMIKQISTIEEEENVDTVGRLPNKDFFNKNDMSNLDNSLNKSTSSLDQLQTFALKKTFPNKIEQYEYKDMTLADLKGGNDLDKESSISSEKQQEDMVLENLKSAYKTNFIEIEQIGKGGFGQVYNVKNRLDNLNYAVKKIKLDINQKDITKKTLKEVNFLSRLQHNHIVRYYQAWLEKPNDETLKQFIDEEEEEEFQEENESEEDDNDSKDESKESSTIEFYNSEEEEESSFEFEFNDDGIVFEDSDSNQEEEDNTNTLTHNNNNNTNNQNKSIPFKKFSCDVDDGDQEDIFNKSKKKKNKDKKKEKDFRILHIQMEYCGGSTLREKIDNEFFCKDVEKRITAKNRKALLAQILEALKYLHEKEMIHRDLKPQNILLDSNGQIKLVDFGLATTLKHERQVERKAVQNLKRASSVQSGLYTLNSTLGEMESREKKSEYSSHCLPSEITRGVGTGVYRAPEQENTSNYCTKADMYSLGIIIFEMWYPLPTFMEKYQILKEIREKNTFPADFTEKVGAEAKEIRDMLVKLLDPNPNKRYSAEELLKTLEDEQYLEHLSQITNPNNSDHRKLISLLFKVSNLPSVQYSVEPYIKQIKFSQSYQLIQDRIISVFDSHGGIYIESNPLIPLNENIYLNKLNFNSKQNKLQFRVKIFFNIIKRDFKSIMLANTGTLIEYSDNLLMPWIQQVKARHYLQMKKVDKKDSLLQKELSSLIKRYTFGTIQYQDSEKKKFYPIESKRASFDIVYMKDDEYLTQDISQTKLYYEANLIRVAFELIRQFCKDTTKYKIRIGFSGLLDMLISSIKIQEETFLRILSNKNIMELIQNMRQNEFRQISFFENILFQQYGISKESTQQIISYFKINSESLATFKELLEERLFKYQNEISLIYQHLEDLSTLLELFKIPKEVIHFDTCLLPDNLMYHSGLVFDVINYEELEFQKKRSSKQKEVKKEDEKNSFAKIFIKGGRYDHFFFESQKQQQQAPEGLGFQVYIDEIFNHYFRPSLQQQEETAIQQQLQDYNEIDTVIISQEEDLREEKFAIADEMWNHQIKAHVITDPVVSIFRLMETLKKNKTKFLITVKKNQKVRYILKNLQTMNQKINEKEREYELNDIIEIISKAKFNHKTKYVS